MKSSDLMTMELLRQRTLWKKRENALHQVRAEEALNGKDIIMFYFGSSLCKLHVEFLPALKEVYEVVTTHDIPLEIIYISTECNVNEFRNHFSNDHGDWLAVPSGDELHPLLEYKYEINSIPRAVVVKKSGTVITLNAYQEILEKGKYALLLWISPFM